MYGTITKDSMYHLEEEIYFQIHLKISQNISKQSNYIRYSKNLIELFQKMDNFKLYFINNWVRRNIHQ